ncbi:hypothetical protein FHX74_000127 [Friedmanniella endophytica]|uniref:Uncharacterized protein n=1 Tax=Microlunatus kandeliicorticis TaxID=1759536 RepID=A0A7W3INX0_9ACTN|nr:hypothetical protein [Microlunatus kandeliicorticis]MBA8792533.1 hypothetical protein [Microlunatus kandeliicorticis]
MTHVYAVASELEAARASYCLGTHRRPVTRHAGVDGTVLVAVEGCPLPETIADALRVAAPSARLSFVSSDAVARTRS